MPDPLTTALSASGKLYKYVEKSMIHQIAELNLKAAKESIEDLPNERDKFEAAGNICTLLKMPRKAWEPKGGWSDFDFQDGAFGYEYSILKLKKYMYVTALLFILEKYRSNEKMAQKYLCELSSLIPTYREGQSIRESRKKMTPLKAIIYLSPTTAPMLPEQISQVRAFLEGDIKFDPIEFISFIEHQPASFFRTPRLE